MQLLTLFYECFGVFCGGFQGVLFSGAHTRNKALRNINSKKKTNAQFCLLDLSRDKL